MLRLGPNLDAVNTYYTASHSHRQRVCNNSLEAPNKINICHSMLFEQSPFQRAQWYARAALLPENIRNGDTQDTADAHGR
jgi:hypothetical protein